MGLYLMNEMVIELGKALVNELSLDPGVDTLAKWMAHYIAEKMIVSETAAGKNKDDADKECFETILKLWQHRSMYPEGKNPYERFEPIFKTLEKLDHEGSGLFYNRRFNYGKNDVKAPPEVKQWLDRALDIDQVARIWMEYVLHQATLSATDEDTAKWLDNSNDLEDSIDSEIIMQLLHRVDTNDKDLNAQDMKQRDIDRINAKIDKLLTFREFSETLINRLKQEIDEIKLNEIL